MPAPIRLQLVEVDAHTGNAVAMLRVPVAFLLVLLCVLSFSGRFMDAFLCGVSVAIFYLSCMKDAGLVNFSLVIMLVVMEFMQGFLSSFRLLLLQVGASPELVPVVSHVKFAVFAVGLVAVPIVHWVALYYAWKLHEELRESMHRMRIEGEEPPASGASPLATSAAAPPSPSHSSSARPASPSGELKSMSAAPAKSFSAAVGDEYDSDSEPELEALAL